MRDPLNRPARRRFLQGLAALGLLPHGADARAAVVERELPPFDAIALRTVGDLVVEEGRPAPLRIEAEPHVLKRIVTRVVDGILVIESSGSFSTSRGVHYRVRVPRLRRLENTASGAIEAAWLRADALEVLLDGSGAIRIGTLSARTFSATVAGSGELRVAGRVVSQTLTLTASGSCDAAGLASERARVSVTGSGDARVQVRDELDAEVAGSGGITYFGAPRLRQRTSGSGSIERG
jgi:hypothetical protein